MAAHPLLPLFPEQQDLKRVTSAAFSLAAMWERRGAREGTMGQEGDDGANRGGESATCFFSALLLADLLPPSVSFFRFALRLSRAEKARNCSASTLPSVCLPVRPSVRPSQASAAGVGLQLDDPLPSMVTVVEVQEVRVGIQTVLTYKKNPAFNESCSHHRFTAK